MGVVNVTPDSFSGDGLAGDATAAADLAERMAADGAHLIDVGGESTRPGAAPVDADDELRRVVPAVEAIVRRVRLPVSVDTSKAVVAEAALAAGASIINDVWAPRGRPAHARRRRRSRRAGGADAQRPRRRLPRPRPRRHRLATFEHQDCGRSGYHIGEHHRRSRHRVRQDAGTEPRTAAAARRATGPGTSGPRGRVAEVDHRPRARPPAQRAPRRWRGHGSPSPSPTAPTSSGFTT